LKRCITRQIPALFPLQADFPRHFPPTFPRLAPRLSANHFGLAVINKLQNGSNGLAMSFPTLLLFIVFFEAKAMGDIFRGVSAGTKQRFNF